MFIWNHYEESSMPTAKEVVNRLPLHEVDGLIPGSVGDILEVLNSESLSSERRVHIALSITPPQQLLRTTQYRNQLFTRLKVQEATNLLEELEIDGDTDNPIGTLKSSQFSRGSKREKVLFDFFEVSLPDDDDGEPESGLMSLTAEYGLFDYQRDVFNRASAQLNTDNRVFLHMPTGSGKTRITMSLVCEVLRQADSGVVLWLADGVELLDQAFDEFEEAWRHLGNRDIEISRFYGNHDWDAIDEGFIVAGLRKLWNKEKTSPTFLANYATNVDLVVFDEAHRSVAETYQRMLQRLTLFNDDCRLLGLSATPGRSYANRETDRQLSELYNQNKVALDVPEYEDPFEYLVSEGYLSDPEFHTLQINDRVLSDDLRDQVQAMTRGSPYSKQVLQRLTEHDRRNIQIIRQIQNLIDQGHTRIILFATTVKHARIISAALQGQEITSAVITAATPGYIRDREIEQFRRKTNEPHVLCNYNVLTTGFDAPQTSAAVIARPTTSLVLYSQMVGRAIRGPAVSGTEKADIWTVIDTELPGFGDLAEAFWNWEDVW